MTREQKSALKSLALGSDHPICRDLLKQLSRIPVADTADVRETVGSGITGRLNGVELELSGDDTGKTVFRHGGVHFTFESEERPMPGAVEAVRDLQENGLKVWMLTGDKSKNACRIANELNISNACFEVHSEDKLAEIQRLEMTGARVLMVGDGLNDTAALAAATASIAPGSALDASRNAADIVIVSNRLTEITPALALARRVRQRILQNFGLAVAYNLIAVPIAVLGFASPLAAAIAMSSSSITVVLNAQRGTRL